MKRSYRVGIIGAGTCDESTYQLAWNVGLETGKNVVGPLTWKDIPGAPYASDYHDAVKMVKGLIKNS